MNAPQARQLMRRRQDGAAFGAIIFFLFGGKQLFLWRENSGFVGAGGIGAMGEPGWLRRGKKSRSAAGKMIKCIEMNRKEACKRNDQCVGYMVACSAE